MTRSGDRRATRAQPGMAASRLARTMAACAVGVLTLLTLFAALGAPEAVATTTLRYFPAGSIYEYRWKLLELVLAYEHDTAGKSTCSRMPKT